MLRGSHPRHRPAQDHLHPQLVPLHPMPLQVVLVQLLVAELRQQLEAGWNQQLPMLLVDLVMPGRGQVVGSVGWWLGQVQTCSSNEAGPAPPASFRPAHQAVQGAQQHQNVSVHPLTAQSHVAPGKEW